MTREAGIIGIVSTLIAVFVAIFAVVGTPEQAQQLGTLPIVVVTLLVIGAAIFLLGVPLAARSGHPAMVGFVSGLLGLLLVVPAYSGVGCRSCWGRREFCWVKQEGDAEWRLGEYLWRCGPSSWEVPR